MRNSVSKLLLVAAAVALASTAYAASVHLKGGKNAEPDFIDNGFTLTADGDLSGLGNGDVVITMVAEADVVSTCTNQGGNQAPGQNPAPLTVTGAVAIPDSEVKNGNTPFTVTTMAPALMIEGAPDCPNPNWTETIDELLFTSATIAVEQPVGTTVLVVECTLDPPTLNGIVPKGDVVCTQTQF